MASAVKIAKRDIIWRDEHINAFLAVASRELGDALVMALWTGQRQGTLISVAWQQYDGTCIRLEPNKQRRRKRKKRLVIPVGGLLKELLDARRPEKAEGPILRNSYGEPWTSDGFRSSWAKRSIGPTLVTTICIFTICAVAA
ncbi:hypothetical protein [Bradyrhizobium sp. AS23.2]|uniref:hypothetical protein n=1 Tax=Bradyrhizobium sp. AS23.2 TaxID=1680155 RepID=UPI001160E2B6|nr:hypothetical protein [Bradyrhizobium sp. AS23.2]